MVAAESLLFLGQVPYLFGLFLLIQIWYFIYNHFCPFLDRIPHLRHLNPGRTCVKFGLHLVPLTEFLDWQGSRHCNKGHHMGDLYDDGKDLQLPDWTYYKDLFITLYRTIPWRFTSRLWGQVNDLNLPERLRSPLLGLYVWLFGCNINEALVEDLKHYKNLQEFFKRQLKPEVRPIDQKHALVSPCDGKILHYGEVKNCMLEQVKGVTYCLKTFLGPNNWHEDEGEEEDSNQTFHVDKVSDEEYLESLNIKEGNKLFHCIIYLAPGDYHRFHSPADWSAAHRRHFPGELFSVNPGVAAWIKGLFTLNERVVITGNWQNGFFSMAAVGATNVGSINIYFDEELNTNVHGAHRHGHHHDKSLLTSDPEAKSPEKNSVQLEKGAGIGEFNLGSTIVLIFEAPADFKFNMEQGEKVRVGQRMGNV